MSDPRVVRMERLLPGPIEKVWQHLVDPARARTWLANDVELEPEVGGDVTLRLEDGEVVRGTVTRFEPPHVVAYTWGRGEVHFELSRRQDGVLLVLTHKRVSSTSARTPRAHLCKAAA